MIKTFFLTEPQYNIDEILRYCGARANSQELIKTIDECIKELEGKLQYHVCFDVFSIKNSDTLEFANIKSSSKALKTAFKGCDRVLVFAATIGMEIDRTIAKYSVCAPSKAVVFQSIGAERIEALCDAFCEKMKGEMSDCTLKRRVSCGYGDIPLEMQEQIFELLDCSRKIGLTLNKSFLMSPSKSVTAFVGVGKIKE